MGVNLSSLMHYYVRGRDRSLSHLVVPALGFLVCLYLWLSLSVVAKIAGGAWLLGGIAYGAWKTGGFRSQVIRFEAPPED
jgi:hypothetical protein